MAITLVSGDICYSPLPILANQGPAIGRVTTVAANANIVWYNGGGFGSEGFPFVVQMTDVQFQVPFVYPAGIQGPTTGLFDPPGTIGILNLDKLGGASGPFVRAAVLQSFWVHVNGGVNPWTGGDTGGVDAWHEIAYLEILDYKDGVPKPLLGPERMILDLGVFVVGGTFDPSLLWTRLTSGPGINYAGLGAVIR